MAKQDPAALAAALRENLKRRKAQSRPVEHQSAPAVAQSDDQKSELADHAVNVIEPKN